MSFAWCSTRVARGAATADAMTSTASRPPSIATPTAARLPGHWPSTGLAVVLVLVVAAIVVPKASGWDVVEDGVHPLSAVWDPRVGPGTGPSIALAVAALRWAPRFAATLRLRVLLPLAYLAGVAWMVALATVDGVHGLEFALAKRSEYLPTARSVHDVSTMLHQFIDRIPFTAAPHNWPINIAGHPPGILMIFVGLDRMGLGGDLAAALAVVLLAATAPIAVLATLRRLGAEAAGRTALPFLVFGPAAIWTAVSADAVIVAVTSWGVALLAIAATSTGRATALWSLAAGVMLGFGIFLSYGMVLMGLICLAVLVAARRMAPLAWGAAGAAAVVAMFASAGFAWWRAYPVLTERYWSGAAHLRPGGYWTWADLALLAISAGPVLGPALASAGHAAWARTRDVQSRVVVALVASATAAIVVADASQMSRGEVERIWLPFEPWLLLSVALLPRRWRVWGFAGQLAVALVVQSLLFPRW